MPDGSAAEEQGGNGAKGRDSEEAATPGGNSAAAVAVAPAPAIVKKVQKVVEMRLDAPELAVALQQLSEFYGKRASAWEQRVARVLAGLPPPAGAPACRAGLWIAGRV